MKTNYIVVFDFSIEAYCESLKGTRVAIDEMVDAYACQGLTEKAIRKDVEVYKVTRVRG